MGALAGEQVERPGAVVTGAGHGIGAAIATRLAAEGLRVVVNDIDADAVHAVARRTGALAVPGDAVSTHGAQALVDAARAHLGEVDVWFGNAGVDLGRGLAATEEDWAECHEVNVMAHVRAARLLVPSWAARGHGRYVVTASAAGLLTMLGSPTYSVSKHGAVAFAEWLAATYRHRGVVVQAICPQGVRTRMLEQADEGVRAVLTRDAALTPEEVADAAWQALSHERFLVLPHPEVGAYFAARAADTDAWLAGMNRLQQRVEREPGVDAAGREAR